MKNILIFLILMGVSCATNQYYFLIDNITHGGPMNNGDCYYIINDSWTTPTILTITDLATILIGQNMSNNYLHHACIAPSQNLSIFLQPNTSSSNLSCFASCSAPQTYSWFLEPGQSNNSLYFSASCSESQCLNTSYILSNKTSPRLGFNESWTDITSNTTCLGPNKLTDTVNVAYGNTITNAYNTGLTIVGPAVCPAQTICPTCQTCQTCPAEKICPTCDICFKTNETILLNSTSPFFIDSRIGIGKIQCDFTSFQTSLFENNSCNATTTIVGTGFTYCPAHMPTLCNDNEKASGMKGLEDCINRLAVSSAYQCNQTSIDLAAKQREIDKCKAGNEESANLLGVIIIGVCVATILGVIIYFVAITIKKKQLDKQ